MNSNRYARELPIVIFTALVMIIFSVATQNFLSIGNLRVLGDQSAQIGIVSVTVTMVIILGGIDLSVGSLMALVAAIVGMLLNQSVAPPVACIVGLAVGAFCGLINGLLITLVGIPDIIATLGTMYCLRGIAVIISGGAWLNNFPSSFDFYGKALILGVPFPVLFWLFLSWLASFVLSGTWFGRRIYAIGGNSNAARLAGIDAIGIKTRVYVMSGITAAIAGIVFASKTGSVQVSTLGLNMAFNALAAVLIGGASIFGGAGTVLGTTFGVIALAAIQNGLIQIRASPFWIDATVGGLIVAAVFLNTFYRLREERERSAILQ